MKPTLREIREQKGVKKGAVAAAMGVTYPTYQKYEEENAMPEKAYRAACEFLGMPENSIGATIFLAKSLN